MASRRILLFIAGAITAAKVHAQSPDVGEMNAFRVSLERVSQEYAGSEKNLFESLDISIAAIPRNPLTDLIREEESLNVLKNVVHRLRELSETIAAKYLEYLDNAHRYQTALADGAIRYQQIAAHYRSLGSNEPYSELREQYDLAADLFEAFAARCKAVSTNINPQIEKVSASRPYFEHTCMFLANFDKDLEGLATFSAGATYADLTHDLKEYVQTYERLQGSLRSLRDHLRGAEPEQPTPYPQTAAPYPPRPAPKEQSQDRFVGNQLRPDPVVNPFAPGIPRPPGLPNLKDDEEYVDPLMNIPPSLTRVAAASRNK